MKNLVSPPTFARRRAGWPWAGAMATMPALISLLLMLSSTAYSAPSVGMTPVISTIAATAAPSTAPAATPAEPLSLEQQVRELALAGTRPLAAAERHWRVEVQVGTLDARLRLAPCQRAEPYLGVGTRLWGKTRVGLRCVQGAAAWNVFVPVTVKVFARALVATSPLAAGTLLTAADLGEAEVDLAEEPSAALLDAPAAVGRTLQRAAAAGQSLRQSHLKLRQWFAAGDMVQVQATGDGFSVAGEGQALTHGVEGEPARVRTEAGRVLTGMPVAERRMVLPL